MTTKRRINLVVDDEVHQTISEMAAIQGKSRAGLIMELVRSVHPALKRTLLVMKAAQQYQGEIPDELEQVINAGLGNIQRSSTEQLHMLDELHDSMRSQRRGGADAQACPSPARS